MPESPLKSVTVSLRNDLAVGASLLLPSLAIGFALVAVWVMNSTYAKYRGRTDLDMPDWFVINMGIMEQVVPLGACGVLCLVVSGVLFAVWARQAGWATRIGYATNWFMSATVVGVVFLPWLLPGLR